MSVHERSYETGKFQPRDLAGQRFGRLVAMEVVGVSNDRQRLWKCMCDCGTEKVVKAGLLRRHSVQSCGCLWRERMREEHGSHLMSRTPQYGVWNSMIERCTNPNQISFPNYGGRGIKVCERWRSFDAFWEDMGSAYKPGLSIDRVDPDGDYESSNCRWATDVQQANNRKSNRRIEVFGESLTLAEASRKYNVPYGALKNRIRVGWEPDKAVMTPIRKVVGR